MNDIMTATEVSAYLRQSLPNLKYWVAKARKGESNFPLPVSPKGSKLRWRRKDIETWSTRFSNAPAEPTLQAENSLGHLLADFVRWLEEKNINANKKGG